MAFGASSLTGKSRLTRPTFTSIIAKISKSEMDKKSLTFIRGVLPHPRHYLDRHKKYPFLLWIGAVHAIIRFAQPPLC